MTVSCSSCNPSVHTVTLSLTNTMIPPDGHHQTRSQPAIAIFNLTQQLKFESANSSDSDSNMVWIILFSLVIFISILSNSLYILSNLKRRCLTHTLLAIFFLINLLDYILLVLEFSFDQSGQFSYGVSVCSVYQSLHQASPLLTSALLLYMIYHAAGLSLLNNVNSRTKVIWSTVVFITILLLPSIFFSEIAVYPSTASYCVIDLSGVANKIGLDINTQHIVTALYFILYKSVLSFWLPLLLLAAPLVKLMKMVNTEADKNMKISVSVSIAVSYIVFNLPLASVRAVRQIILIRSAPMAYNEKYVLDIAESLLTLLSFFYHIFRPLVCLVLQHAAQLHQEASFILNEKFEVEEKKLIPRKGDEEE